METRRLRRLTTTTTMAVALLLAGCSTGAPASTRGDVAVSPAAGPAAGPSAVPKAERRPAPQPVAATLPRCSHRARACVDTHRRIAWLQQAGRLSFGPVPVSLGTRAHP